MAQFFAIITAIALFFQGFAGMVTRPFTKEFDYEGLDKCKNVIFMIGDGMGFNSIEKAKYELGIDLVIDTLPLQGESKTRSTSSSVTDSAAGGTALATATRTTNRYIGVYNYDAKPAYSHPMNLCELAIEQGKLAGVITTDSTAGATPGSFTAHSSDRDNESDITGQQMANEDLTVMWGTTAGSFNEVTATSHGWTDVVTDAASMEALTEGSRSFGQFTDELWHTTQTNDMPTLAEMTAKAIDLLDDDEDGFFLMVEGAHIDKNNHANNGEGMKDAMVSFNDAIQVALDYAAADGETLIVITADHETGGITWTGSEYVYTKTGHTGVNVPLRIYGCANFIEDGEAIKNCEVSKRVAAVMGCYDFPQRVTMSDKIC